MEPDKTKVSPHHPLAELLAKKLSGVECVPFREQQRMVQGAIRAAVAWHEERVKELEEYKWKYESLCK